jgi:hypothetical protein
MWELCSTPGVLFFDAVRDGGQRIYDSQAVTHADAKYARRTIIARDLIRDPRFDLYL